jgi:hypothetical protein
MFPYVLHSIYSPVHEIELKTVAEDFQNEKSYLCFLELAFFKVPAL